MAEVSLSSGHKMPMVAFGTFLIPKPETKQAVLQAIRAGYTHIDAASFYQNESEIGEALTELFTSGEKTRDQLYITTKVHPSKYRNIRLHLQHQLQRLQLTYIDQYLLHWPFALEYQEAEPPQFANKLDRYPLHLAWAQMESFVEEGLVRSIGVSNWTVALLNDMLGYAKIPPVVNQFEIHPYNKRTELVEYCLQNNIRPVGYKVIYKPLNSRFSDFQKCPLDEKVVIEVGEKYGKSPAQVLLAWCLGRGCGCVSKTVNQERMRENLAAGEVRLEREDLEKISGIPDQGEHIEVQKIYGIPIYK